MAGDTPILGAKAPKPMKPKLDLIPDPDQGWSWIGRFGILLSGVGLYDLVLLWVPTNFGNVDWEFGTVGASMAGLPLVTMGLAAMFASAVSTGAQKWLRGVSVLMFILGLWVFASLVMFALDLPLAFAATGEGPGRLIIIKAVAKTVGLGGAFGSAYLAGGVLGWRLLAKQKEERENQ